MNDQQQREIAHGLRHGHVDAWHALYDAYSPRVWRMVAALMGAAATDVADVVQESFLAAAASARKYDPDRGALWHWLSGIARNKVALHYRRQARQERIKDATTWLAAGDGALARWFDNPEAEPTAVLDAAETATLVRATLAELPDEYHALLTEKYLDGASVEQLATARSSTSTAIRSKLARARRAFREIFERLTTTPT